MATVTLGNSYRFKDYNNNKYLNILTDGTPTNNTNVTIYSLDSSDMAQVWKCDSYTNSNLGVSGALMKSVKNSNVALDRWRGSSNYNNADVYAIGTTAADLKDQLVEFRFISNGYYRIKLVYYDLYLTVSNTATYGGYNVKWQELTGNEDQLWAAELYSTSTTNIPETPEPIADKEFFVKAYGTNYNLNVWGNNTVTNSTNVTIYNKECVSAQKWIAKQTPNGPKLFTKINPNYTLSINATNNNCMMYSSSVSDDNTVLEFEEMADMLYRIKMHNHNKYLCISSGSTSGSNVYWTSDINSATYWEFIPESTMFAAEIREFWEKPQRLFDLPDEFLTSAVSVNPYETPRELVYTDGFTRVYRTIKHSTIVQASGNNTDIGISYEAGNMSVTSNGTTITLGNFLTDFLTPDNFQKMIGEFSSSIGLGNLIFKYTTDIDIRKAKMEIIWNFPKIPGNSDITINRAITLTLYFEISDLEYAFETVPVTACDDFFLMALAIACICIGAKYSIILGSMIIALLPIVNTSFITRIDTEQ